MLILGAIAAIAIGAPNRVVHWYPAALVGLAPLFYLCWRRTICQQLKYCTAICLGFCALVFLPDPLSVKALTPAEIIGGIAVSPLVPLYFIAASLLSLQLSRHTPAWFRPIAIALVWTGFDGLFAVLEFPLPLHYGACLFDFPTAIQIADIASIWGVTFLAVLTNATVAAVCISFGTRRWWQPLACPTLIWTATVFYGSHQIAAYGSPTFGNSSAGFTIGTVQQVAWLEDDRRWSYKENRYRELQDFTQAAIGAGAELVVWPEGAMRAQVAGSALEELYVQPMSSLLPEGGGLLVGSSELAEPNADGVAWDAQKFINTALLYNSEGRIRDRYGKQWLFRYFETSRFIPSREGYRPIDGGDRLGALGTQICLESVMPKASRELVRGGAESLIAISDDSWFGRSNWPILHGILSVFRAIENRRSFAFVNNTGGNLIVMPSGAIAAWGELWEKGQISGPTIVNSEQTVANRYGDWLVWMCLIACGGLGGQILYARLGRPGRSATDLKHPRMLD